METTSNTSNEIILTLDNEQGLHARPADLFVRRANEFNADIVVFNQTRDGSKKANAKSILGILSIGVRKGDTIRIVATGQDSEIAISQLGRLVQSNFQDGTQ